MNGQVHRRVQATVAGFQAEQRCGTVLLDNGTQLSFDATAFDHSGLRLLRPGQRVTLECTGDTVLAMRHIAFPFLATDQRPAR